MQASLGLLSDAVIMVRHIRIHQFLIQKLSLKTSTLTDQLRSDPWSPLTGVCTLPTTMAEGGGAPQPQGGGSVTSQPRNPVSSLREMEDYFAVLGVARSSSVSGSWHTVTPTGRAGRKMDSGNTGSISVPTAHGKKSPGCWRLLVGIQGK